MINRLFRERIRFLGSVRNRRRLWGLSFVMPVLLFFAVFAFYPMLNALYVSMTDYSLIRPPEFVGWSNYGRMVYDPRFRISLVNTFVYSVGSSIPIWVLSLGLALVLARDFRGRNFVRVLYFLPVIVSGVVVAMVWRVLYHPHGPINATIEPLLGVFPNWLTDRNLAPWAVIAMNVWQSVGFYMLIFIAGLQEIPEVFDDAAEVDGANRWQVFWYITIPLLKPTMLFVMVITLINCFQSFTYQYIMTKGGPSDATNVIGLYVYQNAFQYMRMGYAAAISLVLFVIIMVLTLIQLRVMRSDETGYV
ncbi:MAG: carbohydrate ABC transporter permease [bacterium]